MTELKMKLCMNGRGATTRTYSIENEIGFIVGGINRQFIIDKNLPSWKTPASFPKVEALKLIKAINDTLSEIDNPTVDELEYILQGIQL